jgi:Ni,Fe-hydrogenase III large subunit
VDIGAVPCVARDEFCATVVARVGLGDRIAALFAYRDEAGAARLMAVLAHGAAGSLSLVGGSVGSAYEAMTPRCLQAHLFEREIAEQYGIVPSGHPWPRPVRFHAPFGSAASSPPPVGITDFFRMHGEEVHEVAVGPVHAGVIEPGHFRFQCHGEDVYHLEISLGYQHRGVEQALLGGPRPMTLYHMETLAGDTTIGHATTYCQLLETLGGTAAPMRAQVIRGIALELERCANHTGDLGALAGDIGYQPTMSFCGRIRGDFLNMTALICGSRFGRGLVVPGGVGFDLDAARVERLRRLVATARRDFMNATALLWAESSVMARFENTGTVSRADARALGLVGPAARASGLARDVRQDFPEGVYRFHHLPVDTAPAGDVHGRAYVRWREVQQSLDFVEDQLANLPEGLVRGEAKAPAPGSLVVSLTEGWRGEVCHVALTDAAGRFLRYKIVDPSFHNWSGLALALRGQSISDFPLCNKSFNLSYCGHDL